MQLAALKIGIGVPSADFTATVRSVFRHACLIAIDGGEIVTLAPAAAGGLPGGITIALPDDLDFTSVVAEGARVSARAGMLRLAGASLAIDLRAAVPWRSHLDRLTLALEDSACLAAWHVAAQALAADGRADMFRSIAGDAIPAMLMAARRRDAGAARQAAASLVGLGAGGTPAGDDFLVGFLAALHSAGPHRGIAAFAAELSSAVAMLARRTNALSAVYLRAACAGEVSERLTDLVAAISRGEERKTATAAAAAIAIGHSSGADGTLGLLAGALATLPAGTSADSDLLAATG